MPSQPIPTVVFSYVSVPFLASILLFRRASHPPGDEIRQGPEYQDSPWGTAAVIVGPTAIAQTCAC